MALTYGWASLFRRRGDPRRDACDRGLTDHSEPDIAIDNVSR
jgi:hypothetical protein